MRSNSVTNAFRPLGLWEPAAAFGGTCIKQHVGRKTPVTELTTSIELFFQTFWITKVMIHINDNKVKETNQRPAASH